MSNHPTANYRSLVANLTAGWAALPDKPGESPESTLQALWSFVSGSPRTNQPLPELDAQAAKQLKELIQRRLAGEPLAYIIGRQNFAGLEFLCGPEAMIPRQETELLVEVGFQLLRSLREEGEMILVLDLCSGSGNVGLALAERDPRFRVIGGDISEDAVHLAQQNAAHLGLTDRTHFLTGNFLEPFEREKLQDSASLITCNPPYISTGSLSKLTHEISGFEPQAAFNGGPFGLSILMRLVKEAHAFLRPSAWVACETGSGQGVIVAEMFQKSDRYQRTEVFKDHQDTIRVVAAQRK